LIQSFVSPNKEDTPPATLSIDYKFHRQPGTGSADASDLLNIWEVGGGRALTKLLEVPLATYQLPRTLVLIVLDLSKPARLVNDANYWLGVVRSHMMRLKAEDSDLYAKMQAEALQSFGDKHKDLPVIDLLPLPVVLVANKFDVIKDRDLGELKTIARTLRALAHFNGASLLYCSRRSQQAVNLLRGRINRHIKGGEGKKALLVDHTKPMAVSAGADSFEDIGDPSGKMSTVSTVPAWTATCARTFQPTDDDKEEESAVPQLRLAPEQNVDNAVLIKEEDLKRTSRNLQMRRRLSGVEIKATR